MLANPRDELECDDVREYSNRYGCCWKLKFVTKRCAFFSNENSFGGATMLAFLSRESSDD